MAAAIDAMQTAVRNTRNTAFNCLGCVAWSLRRFILCDKSESEVELLAKLFTHRFQSELARANCGRGLTLLGERHFPPCQEAAALSLR